MTRPRGRPPIPSAMSSPSDPVEIVSISTFSREPSFIALPLPNARSICARAASRAFALSISAEFLSETTLSDAVMASKLPYCLRAGQSTRFAGCTASVLQEQEENENSARETLAHPFDDGGRGDQAGDRREGLGAAMLRAPAGEGRHDPPDEGAQLRRRLTGHPGRRIDQRRVGGDLPLDAGNVEILPLEFRTEAPLRRERVKIMAGGGGFFARPIEAPGACGNRAGGGLRI